MDARMDSFSVARRVKGLSVIGAFRMDLVCPDLTAGEIGEIAAEHGHDLFDCGEGWAVSLSRSSLLAVTLRRIAGALGDEPSLARVPRHEVVSALGRAIDHAAPGLAGSFETLPDGSALDALLYLTGCGKDGEWVDFAPVTDWIGPDERETAILRALRASLDCSLGAASLIRAIGLSGQRTTFNDRILPAVPFIAGGRNGEPVRLLGQRPAPSRQRQADASTFMGIEASEDGSRLLIEYRLTDEAVETASFHIPPSAKALVAGSYAEERSGATVSFNMETKHARKLAGLRTVIRKLYPDFVAGQRAFVLLDKEAGTAHVEVLDAIDHEGRERVRALMSDAPVGPSMAA